MFPNHQQELQLSFFYHSNFILSGRSINENAYKRVLEKIKGAEPKKKLELFSLKKNFIPGNPLLLHDEPLFYNEKIIGSTTSSNYSFCYKKNICLAYVDGGLKNYEDLSIEVEGKKYLLKHEKLPIHDPKSIMLRS